MRQSKPLIKNYNKESFKQKWTTHNNRNTCWELPTEKGNEIEEDLPNLKPLNILSFFKGIEALKHKYMKSNILYRLQVFS